MKKILSLIIFLIPIIFIISCPWPPLKKPKYYEPKITNCDKLNSVDIFTQRAYFTLIGDLYIIGGTSDGVTGLNDVWYLTGSGWQQLTSNAGFSGRWGHTSVEKDNKI